MASSEEEQNSAFFDNCTDQSVPVGGLVGDIFGYGTYGAALELGPMAAAPAAYLIDKHGIDDQVNAKVGGFVTENWKDTCNVIDETGQMIQTGAEQLGNAFEQASQYVQTSADQVADAISETYDNMADRLTDAYQTVADTYENFNSIHDQPGYVIDYVEDVGPSSSWGSNTGNSSSWSDNANSGWSEGDSAGGGSGWSSDNSFNGDRSSDTGSSGSGSDY